MRHLPALLGLGLFVFGAIASNVALMLLGATIGIAGLAASALLGVRKERSARTYDDLSGEERTLVRPFVNLHREIEALVDKHGASPVVKVIGREALAESATILGYATRLLEARSQLRKALAGKVEAKHEIERMRGQFEGEASESVRASFETAIAARETELTHYAGVETALARIESSLRQAEAGLAELRTRLAVSASTAAEATATEGGDLRETLANLRALGASLDEADKITNVIGP
ncbi:MAG: hypothetical protein KIS66_10390 [Fimbriimonadaceae bacterium]|nr:hypothetical protein [Fimbriimonadaceae bacterium]